MTKKALIHISQQRWRLDTPETICGTPLAELPSGHLSLDLRDPLDSDPLRVMGKLVHLKDKPHGEWVHPEELSEFRKHEGLCWPCLRTFQSKAYAGLEREWAVHVHALQCAAANLPTKANILQFFQDVMDWEPFKEGEVALCAQPVSSHWIPTYHVVHLNVELCLPSELESSRNRTWVSSRPLFRVVVRPEGDHQQSVFVHAMAPQDHGAARFFFSSEQTSFVTERGPLREAALRDMRSARQEQIRAMVSGGGDCHPLTGVAFWRFLAKIM